MKYLFSLLLFVCACRTTKQQPYDARFALTAAEVRTSRLAKLDNGNYIDYHAIGTIPDQYPELVLIGHGQIYAINGVMQSDTAHHYFFTAKKQ